MKLAWPQEGINWVGGHKYTRCRWTYQLLCLRYGPQTAAGMLDDPDILLWPDEKRPAAWLLQDWYDEIMGLEVYETRIPSAASQRPERKDVPEKFERMFYKMLDNLPKYDGVRVIRANANAAVALAEKAARGELDEKDAKILVAVNNGVGWVQDKMFNAPQRAQTPSQQTNVFLPFAEPPKPKSLREGKRAKLIEAQFTKVEADGSG